MNTICQTKIKKKNKSISVQPKSFKTINFYDEVSETENISWGSFKTY